MAMDTPARIAIIGAGPIGLEAALYARFLGYDVDIYEQGEIADQVRRWGHVHMFSPFGMNSSTLGRAALAAQDPDTPLPAEDAMLTGREYYEQYLDRLARSDLVEDGLHLQTEVVAVSRPAALKTQIGDPERGEAGFRLLLRHEGTERTATCDILLDASGTYDRPLRMGPGGAPAVGELDLAPHLRYHLPDIAGDERPAFEGRHTVVVGSGYSAATAVCQLADLAEQVPDTRITWLTRRPVEQGGEGPVTRFPDDPLASRDALARRANELAAGENNVVQFLPHSCVQSVRRNEAAQFELTHNSEDGESGTIACDQVLSLVGYRGRDEFLSELQVERCYATDGPRKLAAALLGEASSDCLAHASPGVEALRHPEPHFYILGAKSYGRNSAFLIATGVEQIRDLFALIGDRADLDLYAGARTLPS